jgi:hypothetical protein
VLLEVLGFHFSGGDFGLEGSLLTTLVLFAAGTYLFLKLSNKRTVKKEKKASGRHLHKIDLNGK